MGESNTYCKHIHEDGQSSIHDSSQHLFNKQGLLPAGSRDSCFRAQIHCHGFDHRAHLCRGHLALNLVQAVDSQNDSIDRPVPWGNVVFDGNVYAQLLELHGQVAS